MARAKKEKPKTHKSLALRLCMIAFVLYAVVVLVDMQVTLANSKQEVGLLEQQIETQRLANKDLQLKLEQGVDKEYIERVARDQLDMVYPDEQVFIDISGS